MAVFAAEPAVRKHYGSDSYAGCSAPFLFLAASDRFVGFQNYLAVLRNHAFKLAAANTAKFILVCIPLLLLFSLAVSLMLASFREKRGMFKTSFLVPMAVPVASIVLLWRVFFHKNGLLNAFFALWGMVPVDWVGSKAAFGVLVFAYLWKNFGYDMVLWLSGLSAINPALYEAAQIDGAGSIQRFVRITLPNLMPTLFTITVLSLLNSFKVFREAYLIAGGYPDDSIYMLQHLFNNWYGNLDVDKMCAGAVMMAILVFILILLMQKSWTEESGYERGYEKMASWRAPCFDCGFYMDASLDADIRDLYGRGRVV